MKEGSINLIKYFYSTLTFTEDNKLWKLGRGVPQGAISSPDTFCTYIDDLIKKLNSNPNSDVTSGYADDLLTLGQRLEALINTVEIYLEWAKENNMEIN